MTSNSKWKKVKSFFIVIGAIIAIPLYILLLPIIKTIVTIMEPYLYRKQTEKFDKVYQEYRKKDIYIDFPPEHGTLWEIGPWVSWHGRYYRKGR